MSKPVIFTIGYSGLAPVLLKRIAEVVDADVIDCRWRPTSRNPAYRHGSLKTLLGDRYIWMGSDLGGDIGDGVRHTSPQGINWLRRRTRNSLLMCMCHAPGTCHRHLFICQDTFPDAVHIFEDELFLESELAHAIRYDTDYSILGSLSDLLTGRAELGDLLP